MEEKQVSRVVIEFPNGPHTTPLTIQYINVDPAQIEIAGHFLIRQTDSMNQQAKANEGSRIAVASRMPNV